MESIAEKIDVKEKIPEMVDLILSAMSLDYLKKRVIIRFTSTRRGRCAYFHYNDVAEIRLPNSVDKYYRGYESTTCHELAHAIVFCLYGRSDGIHGNKFKDTLEHVVKTWYSNPNDYNWNIEYSRIRLFAQEKGYLKT